MKGRWIVQETTTRKELVVRAVPMLCVLCLSIAGGVASGSMGNERYRLAKHFLPQSRARFLFGDATVERGVAYAAPGRAKAFAFRSSRRGTVTAISVYVDARNRATVVVAGLYANSGGHPGRLLASRMLRSPKRGRWNTVSVRSTAVKARHTYWVAVLGKGGRLYIRDRAGRGCASENSWQHWLASLPALWRMGSRWDACPVSVYLRGSVASAGSPGTNCAGPAGSRTVSQASLDTCGLPSMNTTGPPAGTRLISSGGFTASTPGAVYDGLNVSGSIHVAANNVTIENSSITDVDPNSAAIQIASGVTGTHVNYTSIHGTNAGQSGALAFAVSYYGSSITGVTMDHDNFYNGDRILNGYGTVTNSYCLGGAVFTSGGYLEHDECIYTDGGAPGIRAIHDTLLVDNGQTAAIFVDNPDYGGGGVDGTIDVENSILAGGFYCIYGGAGTSSPHTGPVTIKNSRFSRIFYSNCGQYGTDGYFTHSVTTWSGNVWDDTNQPASD